MPELPEVETVKETLKKNVVGKTIKDVKIFYPRLIEQKTPKEFCECLKNQTINDVSRRGKWLIFHLDQYFLLSHLRMEGKYHFCSAQKPLNKHEHMILTLDFDNDLRYQDTRKFGRIYLVEKEKIGENKAMSQLGLEPWDAALTPHYLQEKYHGKRLPIKSILLDQSIIAGIGNIYADEILFLSGISPFCICSTISEKKLEDMIRCTREILDKAIVNGGTTIRSYTSSHGVSGNFQNYLQVHCRENKNCFICSTPIIKTRVGGRSTYYCPKCQNTK